MSDIYHVYVDFLLLSFYPTCFFTIYIGIAFYPIPLPFTSYLFELNTEVDRYCFAYYSNKSIKRFSNENGSPHELSLAERNSHLKRSLGIKHLIGKFRMFFICIQ